MAPGEAAQFRYGTKKTARTARKVTACLLTPYPAQFSEPADVTLPAAECADPAGPGRAAGWSG